MGETAAAALAVTLRSLADPLRLRMLSAIAADARGESCVCDLAGLADVSQPTVSHHLKVLRDAGVLTSERRGTWVWYRIDPALRPAVTALLASFAPAAIDASQGHDGSHDVDRTGDGVDEALDRLAIELAVAHPTAPDATVLSLVRESHAALTRTAGRRTHLLPLTERFAHQRLVDLARDRATSVPQVLFVCVANAGRSQLAAALVDARAGGRVVARSAGSDPAGAVHAAVRPALDAIDPKAAAAAFPKPLTDDAVRAADVVVTMGCGDVCPVLPGVRYQDWAIGDPALASPDGVAAIRDDIAARVDRLLADLLPTR
ncbi:MULTISPECIES: metalloregulator ArsR/SmtB family transcription factor [unclassified Agrococcus]|uniref:metalloregulator ArsR/SmtB family transcription factor n=1 Tax=unclassified Agrococcus TaxID=2615065 RepID=UPI00361A944A